MPQMSILEVVVVDVILFVQKNSECGVLICSQYERHSVDVVSYSLSNSTPRITPVVS